MNESIEAFRDWAPVRVFWRESRPYVEWCHMGGERFDDPFFQDTVQRRIRLPFNGLFRRQTALASLGDMLNDADTIPPSGFIFHMSRCGSTLISQMLASLPSNIVISEAPPIDSVIGIRNDNGTNDSTIPALKWMIVALGRRRRVEERRYFIKFDSWNTVDLDLITSAFPTVPSIFLYRNPVEVIVSQMNQPGSQMVPGALAKRLPDLTLSVALSMSAEEYCARILSRLLESALRFADDERMLLINYDELPDVVWSSIASHFGINFTTEEIARMKEKSQFNAKVPQFEFTADGEAKRSAASVEAKRVAEQFLDPLYEQLEERRLKRLS